MRQSWFDTPCTSGSYVHVSGDFTSTGQCTIDDSQGLIILHPDHLISVTVIADSFGCIRRAVLQDRVKATSGATPAQVYGHMLHEIFQEALKVNNWDDEWLSQTLERLIPRYYENILDLESNVSTVIEHIRGKWVEVQKWAEIFVRAHPAVRIVMSLSVTQR